MNKLILVLGLLLFGFGVANAEPAHYIVFEFDGSQIKMLKRNLADIQGLRSRTQQEVSERMLRYHPDKHSFAVRLVNDLNESVYHDFVEVPMVLRGEFHGKDGIEGVFVELKWQVFVVRVPKIAKTKLHMRTGARISRDAGASAPQSTIEFEQVFDLEPLAAESAAAQLEQNSEVLPGIINGDPGNRLDFLFMGDGYTSAEKDKFQADAKNLAENFFSITPWKEYKYFVNIHVLFTPSAQSGADHPPYMNGCSDVSCCGDSQMMTDPFAGKFVDTAFDARFCTANIHRLLTANYQKVYDAAKAVPDWDIIFLIVNDLTYGASGGPLSIISTHSSVVQLAQHETGHTFAILADEYDYGCTSNCLCSEPSCPPNVTSEKQRERIKWKSWILPTTPIPTPNDPAYDGVIGLFEGAITTPYGMYRPKFTCMMRTLDAGFCSVCAQEHILKLYEGWGGIPRDGIELIEPGSETPPAGKVEGSWNMTFKVDLLQPVGLLEIKWFVNGQEVVGENKNTFTYTPDGPATVEIRVSDLTQFVKPEMAGALLQFSRRWDVTSAAARIKPIAIPTPHVPYILALAIVISALHLFWRQV